MKSLEEEEQNPAWRGMMWFRFLAERGHKPEAMSGETLKRLGREFNKEYPPPKNKHRPGDA